VRYLTRIAASRSRRFELQLLLAIPLEVLRSSIPVLESRQISPLQSPEPDETLRLGLFAGLPPEQLLVDRGYLRLQPPALFLPDLLA